MAFNRVSAMGVQHGQISPEDEMAANLMRQAQMSALRGSMPSPAPMGQATPELPTPKEPEILNSVGRPAYETDYMNRGLQGQKDLQAMAGQQALDLSKESTNRAFGTVDRQMAPAVSADQREQALFNEQTPIRQLQRQAQQNFLQGSSTDDADLLRGAIAMGRDPTPFIEDRARRESYARQDDQSQQTAISTLMGELAKTNPAAAAKLAQSSKALGGVDPSVVQGAFESMGQKPYEVIAPAMAPELKRMTDFIRSNNWSIAGNQDQLRSLYNSILAKVQTMRPDPDAFRAIQEDLKSAMRDALQENGIIFESAGSDKTRRNFGL
jgi:hypothetical protein